MLLPRHFALLILFSWPDIVLFRAESRIDSPISVLQENLQSCIANTPPRQANIEITETGMLRYHVIYKKRKRRGFFAKSGTL